jgi:acyl carrier protein
VVFARSWRDGLHLNPSPGAPGEGIAAPTREVLEKFAFHTSVVVQVLRGRASVGARQDGLPRLNAPLATTLAHASGKSVIDPWPLPQHADAPSLRQSYNHPGDARSRGSGMTTVDLVREVWAEILTLETVEPDDDFFELGGHSLIVASAVARLGERLGIDLPIRALFEAPTPAEMGELIEELRGELTRDRGASEGAAAVLPDWIVPLQREGTQRPVFVFPAGAGRFWHVTMDSQVAARVGRNHPFWGFQRDDPNQDRLRSDQVETLAAQYVTWIRRIQAKGPFLLYALCRGGFLAWETARQLLAQGEEIAGMLFFEVRLRDDFTSPPCGQSPAQITLSTNMAPYAPEPLPVNLTLLMSAGWQAREGSGAWQEVALGGVETVVMPGDTSPVIVHEIYSIGTELIADHVRDWLERAEARVQGL